MDVFTYYETNIYIREKTWNTRMIIKKRKAGCLNKYFNLGTLWKEVPFVKVGNFNGSTQTQNYVVIIKIVSHMHNKNRKIDTLIERYSI